MKYSDMTIRSKLYLGLCLLVAILVALVAVAYANTARFARANELNNRSHKTLELTQSLLESLINIQTGERGFALTGMDTFLEPLQAGKTSFSSRMEEIKAITADNPEQLERLQKLLDEEQKWLKVAIEPILKMRRGVAAGTIQMESLVQFEQGGRGEGSMSQMRTMQAEVSAAEAALLKSRSKDVAALQSLTQTILVGGGLIATALAVMLAIILIRSIVNPLTKAVKIARTVAAGNLTSNIVVVSKDETGQLLQALKDMNDSLVQMVGEVRLGTVTIAAASAEIAAGNLDLSARTELQANSLGRTASSMAELTGTVRQNAGHASEASQLAASASLVAAKGATAVRQIVTTMASINDSSRRIVDIVSVIDGIAFQTNILALNAAVEAARSGEQGRGFAVVAADVRSLSQRSAVAAREIKALIAQSSEQIRSGSKLVTQAGTTMEDLIVSVNRVAVIIREINVASQEQIVGIEQINQAIAEMDTTTQQNGALVEEAAAAADSLQNNASSLANLMSVFKL